MSKYLQQLDLKDIKITDSLFGTYVKRVPEKIIPHQWKMLNDQLPGQTPTYCIQNFRIAAKEIEGERKGVVFRDTDLYKWLEALAYCLISGYGKEYEPIADDVSNLIEKAQEPDGYLNTYYTLVAPEKKWTNLVEGHELYSAGHLIEAATAYYKATGKSKLLTIAKKNADLICKVFGTQKGQIKGYPGHQEIELALLKLYEITEEAKYLEQAYYFINQRGEEPNYLLTEINARARPEFFPEFENNDLKYFQAHTKPMNQNKAEGHAVRLVYMCAAMADLARENEDHELLEACVRIWENLVTKRMYITGGIGSSGFGERFTVDYDLPNRTNYSESCASIGLMMFGQRMARVTGEAAYYDTVERALYNTVLAGINIEGDRYFYVNPLEVVPEFCTSHTYMEHVKPVRQKWFSVACCPPNIARTLASLGQYIYAQDDQALYIHLFISSETKATIAGGSAEVKMNSSMLQDGCVSIDISLTKPGTLKIRNPHYSETAEIRVNNEKQTVKQKNGYFEFALAADQYEIKINFNITARWISANEQVRENIGKAALVKGPLVYCLEEVDNGSLLSKIYVCQNAEILPGDPADGLIGDIPTLCYKGTKIEHAKQNEEQLYESAEFTKSETDVKAIPYFLWNNRGKGEMLVWQKVQI
ncbi:MAG: glycoside hydrolase family 127 protein [Lachnospiraceae bacterium]